MAAITQTEITRAGINPEGVDQAAAVADYFANSGKQMLYAKNGDASSKTITIATQQTVDGLAVEDLTVTIPAGETRLIGPFPPSVYNDGDGRVQLSYSAVTSVMVAVLKFTANPD
jgi:hypothetical protein